jgi:hypothetical protein
MIRPVGHQLGNERLPLQIGRFDRVLGFDALNAYQFPNTAVNLKDSHNQGDADNDRNEYDEQSDNKAGGAEKVIH